MDWFLYDNGLRHERVKTQSAYIQLKSGIILKLDIAVSSPEENSFKLIKEGDIFK